MEMSTVPDTDTFISIRHCRLLQNVNKSFAHTMKLTVL